VGFFSMAEAAEPSPVDGVHLDEKGQAQLAAAMTPRIAACLGVTI
jgi:lysophospholipase L1-like esterase